MRFGGGMAVRIQVIVDESEAARFKAQAGREGKSLSAWLKDAGKRALDWQEHAHNLKDVSELQSFFSACNLKEEGLESDWPDLKRMIVEGARSGTVQ